MNLMDREDMLAIQGVQMLRVSRLPAGREVRIGELEAIIHACRNDPHMAAAWRDISVLGLLYM